MTESGHIRSPDLRAQITRIVEGEHTGDLVGDLLAVIERAVETERRPRGETEQALAGALARIAQLEREIASRGWDLEQFPQPELSDPWAAEPPAGDDAGEVS